MRINPFQKYLLNPISDSAEWVYDEFRRVSDYLWLVTDKVESDFDDVYDYIDGIDVQEWAAIADAVADPNEIWDAVNAMDWTGHEHATGTCLTIGLRDVVTFGNHGEVAYRWVGPKDVCVGVGGDYVTQPADYQSIGTGDHAILVNRELVDAHPTFAGAGTHGFVPDSVSEQQWFLSDDGAWKPAPVSPIGGLYVKMKWSSDITTTDPGAGFVKCNNADPLQATEFYASGTTNPGNDANFIWGNVEKGEFIGIWEIVGDHESLVFIVDADAVDNTGWWTMQVTPLPTSDPGIDNNQNVECFFISDPANKLPQGGEEATVLAKNALTDYDASWSYRMRWVFQYSLGAQYLPMDAVKDGEWTMVANKVTVERAAPQPLGDPENILPDVPTWVTNSDSSTVLSGARFQFTQKGWYQSMRVWVPAVGATITHRLITIRVGGNAKIEPLTGLVAGEWNTVELAQKVILAGTDVSVFVEALNSGSETSWQYPWTYIGKSNTATPLAGEWNDNVQSTLLRINKEDGDTTDHTLELQLVVNTEITITDSGDPDSYVVYRVTGAYLEFADYYSYPVVVIDTGVTTPVATDGCQIRAIQPVPQVTEYVEILDHWTLNQPDWATITGELRYDDVVQAGKEQSAFGIDINFQKAVISDDWNLLAFSGASSGGGGGGGLEPHVLDYHTDVDAPSPTQDDVLTWDTDAWKSVAPTAQTYLHSDLTDVTTDQHHAQSHAHNGADGSGTVSYTDITDQPTIPPAQTYLHDDLTDVSADQHHAKSHAHDGIDGSGQVDYSDILNPPTIPPAQTYLHDDLTDISADQHHPQLHTVESHSDVTLTAIQNGQILEWDGAKWVNATSATGVTDHSLLSNVTADQHHPQVHNLGSHSDVDTTGIVTGDLLKWDGSKLVRDASRFRSALDDAVDRGSLSSANNLDDFTTTGFYTWGASVPSNAPNGYEYMVLHVHNDPGQAVQMAWGGSSTTAALFIRRRSGGTWNVWVRMLTSALADLAYSDINHNHDSDYSPIDDFTSRLAGINNDGKINSVSNIDTISKTSVYSCYNATGVPTAGTHAMIETWANNANSYVRQLFTPDNGGQKKFRRSTDGGSNWQAWVNY